MRTTVTLPFETKWQGASVWARNYCPNFICEDSHCDKNDNWDLTKTDYFFASEKEALMFMLRWGG
jgi:hypothetical protein